jgi:hypothetical protein
MTKATGTGKGTALAKGELFVSHFWMFCQNNSPVLFGPSFRLFHLILKMPSWSVRFCSDTGLILSRSSQTDLQPKFRSKTNDILISSVTAVLKERASTSLKIEKQIAVEERALVFSRSQNLSHTLQRVDQDRSKRMQERAAKIEKLKTESKVDAITSLYK